MARSKSRRLLLIAKVALAILLLGTLLTSVDVNQIFFTLKSVHWGWGVASVLVACLIILFQQLIFVFISSPFAKVPIIKLLAYSLIGRFFSLFLPSSIGGDVIKAYYITPYFSKPTQAYAAMIMQRLLGGLSTGFVFLIAALYYLPPDSKTSIAFFSISMIVLAVTALLLWMRFQKRFKASLIRHREIKKDSAIYRVVYSQLVAFAAYRKNYQILIGSFLMSIIASLISTGMYLVVAHSLRVSLSFPQALIGSTATALSVLVPLTPGGLGVSEVTFVVVTGAMGLPAEHALSIIVLGRLIGYICTLPGGILYALLPRPVKAGIKLETAPNLPDDSRLA